MELDHCPQTHMPESYTTIQATAQHYVITCTYDMAYQVQ